MEKTIVKGVMKGEATEIKIEGDVRMVLTIITTMLHQMKTKNQIKDRDIDLVCESAKATPEEIKEKLAKIIYNKLMDKFYKSNDITPDDLESFMKKEIENLDIDKLLNGEE